MPNLYSQGNQPRHTDDMQDIITKVPSWILRWGITLFFIVLIMIISSLAFIRYPDLVNASLKIDSPNSPKPIVSKISGKILKLLVADNALVKAGQPLAYLESTADHNKILALLLSLQQLHSEMLQNKSLDNSLLNQADEMRLGELQLSYQSFFTEYIVYLASINNGFLLKKRYYLQKDLHNVAKQQGELSLERIVNQRDYKLAEQEFEMHKKLAEEKVETQAELRQEESKFLEKKTPLIQTESSIISSNDNYATKEKEILELENQIQEEKGKFLQALNSLISEAENWKSKYVLCSSEAGKISYVGIVQENEVINLNQEIFYINPGDEQFFGEMNIAQTNIGKVKVGQRVLIKLKGYPFEEYGMIRGEISYISDIPYKDSVFISKVEFGKIRSSDFKKSIHLKQGMTGEAEIITHDASILQRIGWSLTKLNH